MREERRFDFGPFRLHPVERLLLRDGAEVPLTPKVFELLLALVRRHGHVLDKDELMRQVWPDRVVEEANLTQSIVMLRKALGDSARAPRYVETRHGRGYRFVAAVQMSGGPAAARHARSAVGRARERATLRAALDVAATEGGQLVCVTGEPGIGKTTLVETFITEELEGGRRLAVARGRCSERLAGTGAYLPWLDALESLLQADGDESTAVAMRRLAPTWHAWVAGAPQESEAPRMADVQATSQALMMRELAAFLIDASRRRPLLVFLDDLQWADVSAVDVLAYLATRLDAIRALFVVAYRVSDVLLARHPFLEVKRELEGRGVCREIAVGFLSPTEIATYLAQEFPDHRFPPTLPALLHARTEGNPLFTVDLVRYLKDRGLIGVNPTTAEQLGQTLAGLEHELPPSIRSLIDRKIDHLGPDDRALLATASVQGYEFDSAVVARALGIDTAAVEERLAELERVHGLVQRLAEQELADGTLTLRHRFVHALYQGAFHASLAPSRRIRLSGAVAEALGRCRGEQNVAIAAELAHLYEAAREFGRAAAACCRAAERAAALFAHTEAATLARRGLAALEKLPETGERARQELRLHVTLGVALSITSGYAAAETGSSLTRAYELCRQTDATPQLFPAVWRLWIYHAAGAESQIARTLATRLLRMARSTRSRAQLVASHFALGNTLHLLGDLVSGSKHLERAVTLHDPRPGVASTSLYGVDPGLYCWSHSARALWLLGYPERARRRSRDALALARAVGDPRSAAHALMFAAILHQLRREPEAAQEHAETCIALCDEHGIADEGRRVAIVLGWARAEGGGAETGVAQIRDSLGTLRAMRSLNTGPYYLALLAEALGRAGRATEGVATVDEALREVGRTGERFFEAELHRLRGELLLQGGAGDPRRDADANAAFRRAVEVARRQRARSLELRAVVSTARRRPSGGAREGETLARIYGWFTEGFDTVDLREARALLETRPSPAPRRRAQTVRLRSATAARHRHQGQAGRKRVGSTTAPDRT